MGIDNYRQIKGFTIVELLIVIVVIGILAAITIVAYNGIQQRATNTAIASSLDTVTKQILAYKAQNDDYPQGGPSLFYCATSDDKCTMYDGTDISTRSNSALLSQLGTISNPLESWPGGSTKYFGINYAYLATNTFQGNPSPVLLTFWLQGTNQDCNVVGSLVSVKASSGTDYAPALNNKADTGTNQTRCYEMIRN